MRILKDNILIRTANIDDALILRSWWNDGEIMEHAGFSNGLNISLVDTIKNIKRFENSADQLGIIEIDKIPVGELNYKHIGDNTVCSGWKICDKNYQNKGYGSKIILLFLEYIFSDEEVNSDTKIDKIIWNTLAENKRAQHVYETKTGAKKTEVLENSWKDSLGNLRSSVNYQITRKDFYSEVKKNTKNTYY